MGKGIRTLIAIILGTALMLGGSSQVQAEGGIEVKDVQVEHTFGEAIHFSAQIDAPSPIQKVELIFRDVNEENTRVVALTEADGRFSYTYDVTTNLLPPFAEIVFWFQVTLENGESFTSENHTFRYDDNRFEWQTRSEGNLSVHWHEGNEAFGLAALDSARNGLAKIQSLFPAEDSQPLDIYLYASPADLQNALAGSEIWTTGHASPALGIVLVSIAPNSQQKIDMQRQIPHEMAHVLLYRHLGENYNRLPIWLLEGIASLAELYPNPDYQLALERAVDDKNLIPIATLCQPFSRDASLAFLSYAESASFTRYLHKNYGTSGLDELLRTYADGIACEVAPQRVFGKSLAYLDARWQESALGANLLGVAFRNSLPYLLIFAIILALPFAQAISAYRREKKNEH